MAQNKYQKEFYLKNRDIIRKKHKAHYEANRDKILTQRKKKYDKFRNDFLMTYKKDKSCNLCGWKEHPEILQFHHKDRKTKSFTIGNIKVNERYSSKKKDLIKKEIAKCYLLCPNCHFLLHFKERQK